MYLRVPMWVQQRSGTVNSIIGGGCGVGSGSIVDGSVSGGGGGGGTGAGSVGSRDTGGEDIRCVTRRVTRCVMVCIQEWVGGQCIR